MLFRSAKYSITKTPINKNDVATLKEVVEVLKQFSAFGHFEEMTEIVTKLDNKIQKAANKNPSYIQFESNHLLKGIAYLSPLYQAILRKQTLEISYKSFKARGVNTFIYYPYLLKEYRNRWFLIARQKDSANISILALDRIVSFEIIENELFEAHIGLDFETFFADVIGVSKSEKDAIQKIILKFDSSTAPYILTKPLHSSQIILSEDEYHTTIQITVVLNPELEREIIGFAETVQVLHPPILVRRMCKKIEATLALYQS